MKTKPSSGFEILSLIVTRNVSTLLSTAYSDLCLLPKIQDPMIVLGYALVTLHDDGD